MTTWKVVTDAGVNQNYFRIKCQLGQQSLHKIIFDGHSQIAINANFDQIIDLDQKSRTYAEKNHLIYRSHPHKLVSYYPSMTNLRPFHIDFVTRKGVLTDRVADVTHIEEETDFGEIIKHCVNSYDQLMKLDLWNQEIDVIFTIKPSLVVSSDSVLLLKLRTDGIFFERPDMNEKESRQEKKDTDIRICAFLLGDIIVP